MTGLTHFDAEGHAVMVDVSGKDVTARTATACARIRMAPETLRRVEAGAIGKGDVLALAGMGGTMAAHRTPDLHHVVAPPASASGRVDTRGTAATLALPHTNG